MAIMTNVTLEILSAIILALALPNEFITFGSPLLGILALITHFIALNNAKSLRQICILCFIQSCLCHILSSFWLSNFKDFAIFTLGASALGTGAIYSFTGILFYLPKTVVQKSLIKSKTILLLESNTFKILWFSTIYTLWEYLKCTGFLAYPWGTIHMSFYKAKYFCQIVDITGVRGVTFLISYFSSVISVIILSFIKNSCHNSITTTIKKSLFENKNLIFSSLSIFILVESYGIFQYSKERIPTKTMNTILIQQNIDSWKPNQDEKAILDSQKLTEDGINELKKQGKRPHLVVWSESVLQIPFPQSIRIYKTIPKTSPLINFIRDSNVPMIIGAPLTIDFDERKFSNSAVVFDKDANIQGYYSKIHLVPFAEYIPFTEYEFVRNLLDTLVGFSSGWEPGKEFRAFDIPVSNNFVRVSVPICFEDAFSDIFTQLKKLGTEVFVNISDDSWSLTKSAEYQHFVVAWFRAIEFRTTLLRSTNAGYTVIIDPCGKILADLPLFQKKFLSYSVPVYENITTCYMIFGEWVSILCILLVIATSFFIKSSNLYR